MKLLDVTFQETVNEPDSSTPQLRFTSGQWAIEFAEGVVTVTGSKGQRIVPLGNVRFMTPAPKEAKAK